VIEQSLLYAIPFFLIWRFLKCLRVWRQFIHVQLDVGEPALESQKRDDETEVQTMIKHPLSPLPRSIPVQACPHHRS
jgi:hypothetical protein